MTGWRAVLAVAGAAAALWSAAAPPAASVEPPPSPFLTRPGHDPRALTSLPPGDGRDEVEGICSGCHSLQLVMQQRLSRARWEELLDWMVEEQGMAALDRETRDRVLDYLATHLSPSPG